MLRCTLTLGGDSMWLVGMTALLVLDLATGRSNLLVGFGLWSIGAIISMVYHSVLLLSTQLFPKHSPAAIQGPITQLIRLGGASLVVLLLTVVTLLIRFCRWLYAGASGSRSACCKLKKTSLASLGCCLTVTWPCEIALQSTSDLRMYTQNMTNVALPLQRQVETFVDSLTTYCDIQASIRTEMRALCEEAWPAWAEELANPTCPFVTTAREEVHLRLVSLRDRLLTCESSSSSMAVSGTRLQDTLAVTARGAVEDRHTGVSGLMVMTDGTSVFIPVQDDAINNALEVVSWSFDVTRHIVESPWLKDDACGRQEITHAILAARQQGMQIDNL